MIFDNVNAMLFSDISFNNQEEKNQKRKVKNEANRSRKRNRNIR